MPFCVPGISAILFFFLRLGTDRRRGNLYKATVGSNGNLGNSSVESERIFYPFPSRREETRWWKERREKGGGGGREGEREKGGGGGGGRGVVPSRLGIREAGATSHQLTEAVWIIIETTAVVN